MTEVETIETVPVEERVTLARSFQSVDVEADGRNVYLRCVPFDVPATVSDGGEPYEEEFAREAFDGATKAPNRTLLEFEHYAPGVTGVVGYGRALEARDDALYGHFRVGRGAHGDMILELIEEKVLPAASVFFQPIKSARTAAGVVRRLKVRLDRVALCRVGAYPTAEVLAVRSGFVDLEEEEREPPRIEVPTLPFNPELATYLREKGIRVPDTLRSAT